MNIIPFDFHAHTVRSTLLGGEPWFVAADVAAALGYSATSAATRTLDDEDKGMQTVHTLGGPQTFTVINESGLYALILGSRLESAKRFKRWVTKEVLPSIRRTSGYGTTAAPDPAVLAIIRAAYEEADRAVEHRTRHDFYSSSPRVVERRAAIVAEEAAKRSLDASAVAAANQRGVTEVMANKYGDPDALRLLERQRVRIDAVVSERMRLRAPRRRRR